MQPLPGTELNVYLTDRLRERRLIAFANGVIWAATALALIALMLSLQ